MISGIFMLTLTCCSRYFEAGGSRTALEADIAFVSADQTSIADALVYVVETIGTMHVVTEVFKTDARGHILLKGSYCLPTIVAVRGGSVVVQRETLVPSYQVIVKGGDQPSPDRLAGKPDSKFLGYSRTHKDCG
jgi:hypothetical protein